MDVASVLSTEQRFLTFAGLEQLVQQLTESGYQVVGPKVDQGAIIYGPIDTIDDLPRGWTDEQSPGQYRLTRRDDDAYFGYVVGPHSWKQFLFPPQSTLSRATKTDSGWQFDSGCQEPPKYAFLGVRACELAAMRVQDRVFLSGDYVDSQYQQRRARAMIIAVNCAEAASTCFCTSMGSGPKCESGFDLALTELPEGFVVDVGSPEGQAMIDALETSAATVQQLQAAKRARQQAVDQIERKLDTTDIRNFLLGNMQHPRWDEVAARCLSCTNCTMVCPTCFCSSVTEVADLTGEHVERQRQWDSCFNFDFSYISGGVVRDSIKSRYRQWLTHKLASWHDQFDVSGCVGCGRCITWCPVGIDLTEEVAAMRAESP